jgi:plastocyanin
MKKTWMIVGVVVLLVVIVAAVMWGGMYSNKPSTSSSNSSSNSTNASVAATITYSNSGFSPATTTVKAGDTVAIKNTSSSTMQLDSDPHPVHTDDADLNVGEVAPGQTKTFVVTHKGTFGFHNHLASSNTAKITVE